MSKYELDAVKTVVWYSVRDCGDGSAAVVWFWNEEEACKDQGGFGEPCIGHVETYIGSNIYNQATKNSRAAKLAAAAPELLDALRAASRVLKALEMNPHNSDMTRVHAVLDRTKNL